MDSKVKEKSQTMKNSLRYDVATSPHKAEKTTWAWLPKFALFQKAEKTAWGWLPMIALFQSVGLLFMSWVFVEARTVSPAAGLFFWIALAVLILPAALRLASAEPIRSERIGLILLLGMSLYLVKVMYSPVTFTFPDELSHLRNVNEILETHRLFQENPVQPVTALYPGLPTVTSTLVSLSGISTFTAGILVIGAARLILFLALFLLYEQVSGSAHVASLAVLIYMANPNFLFWTAEYAYEPLALPMVILVLLAVAKRETAGDRRQYIAWTVVALAGLLTVVITHHMSSYILTGLLCALTIFSAVRSRGKQWGPWDLALLALIVTSLWLIFVASLTIKYLSPVFLGAIRSMFNMITEEEQGRELFQSGLTGTSVPLWEPVVTLASVTLIALGLPFGAFEIWKRHRNKVIALLLVAIAVAYLPMQLLRLTKAGWETANRSSEFLFIGIGFVLALGIVNLWFAKWPGLNNQAAFAVLALILFFGGLIAGWPPKARLPRPYLVYANGGYLVKPQVVSVAEWIAVYLGQDNRLAASKADAKMFGAYGQYPFTGSAGGIKDMFFSDGVGPSERSILSKRDIEYIVLDRKQVSWDHMIGNYFFSHRYSPSWELELVDPRVFAKFDGLPGATRMLDAGDIVVYDINMYLASPQKRIETSDVQFSTPSFETTLPVMDTKLSSATNHDEYSIASTKWTLLALPLVFFLPGFVMTFILFSMKSLDISERFLLGIGLSVAWTALNGLILGWTSWGLENKTLWNTLLAGLGVGLGAAILVLLFGGRSVSRDTSKSPLGINFNVRQWTLLALAALIMLTAIQGSRTPAPQKGLEGYTLLWVRAAEKPDSMSVGVASEEFKETNYQIKYGFNGVLYQGPSLKLEPGETWEQTISLPTAEFHGQAFTTYLFRVDDPTEVYRRVVWWPETDEARDLSQ